ncbi:MAG: hypoxanthine phosphoribosyltransferase [Clostridia bacterium]|nr:hypoxanthine phosphoribosyltransferase [Clostridia bacterium]
MLNDFEKVLISKEQLETRIQEMADQISADYQGKKPLFICILKGSIFFMADLLKKLSIPAQVECMAVSSYGADTKSSGEVKVVKDLNVAINGKDVIIVEDIVDSGNTLSYLKRLLLQRNPASLKICTLLDKPERRRVEIDVDYTGFAIPDEFVVGYGLDYAEDYRQLDQVYILKREVYEK